MKIKGIFRTYLDIRKCTYYDFYQFQKFYKEYSVALEPDSVPSPENNHYHSDRKPVQQMPSIRYEFKNRFDYYYGRFLPSLFGRSPFHGCKKQCHRNLDAVNLIPKRTQPLETGDDARELF